MQESTIAVEEVDAKRGQASPLRYQPFLAIANGKLAMLLFLSTEVMFFTALLSSYLVLRFAEPSWPTQKAMHVEWWLGSINTGILIASTIALSVSLRNAKLDRPATAKLWVLIAIGLGIVFTGIKGYEYSEKFSAGFFPARSGGFVYDLADENYLSKTAESINLDISLAGERQNELENQDLESQLDLIRSGLVEWTQYKVGRSADRDRKQMAMDALAYQIYRIDERERIEVYLKDENEEVAAEIERLEDVLKQANSELKSTQEAIQILIPKIESQDPEVAEEYARLSSQAEVQTKSIESSRKQITPLKNRLALGGKLESSQGVNSEFGIRLPMVIPGGKAWINTYFMLSVFHLAHLIIGLVVLVCWLFIRFDSTKAYLLENFSLYWHFVDLVWIVIFAIIYFS